MKTPNDVFEPDARVTPEEQAQALALARALEKGGGQDESLVKAALAESLETAALLRQSQQGKLPEPSHVMDAVLPALQARRKPRRWWLWPAILLPATTVALVIVAVPMQMRSSAPAPVAVPTVITLQPTVELLKAQADLARGDRKALAALDKEMRRYRESFYSALGAR
jgi:hypothetical protein